MRNVENEDEAILRNNNANNENILHNEGNNLNTSEERRRRENLEIINTIPNNNNNANQNNSNPDNNDHSGLKSREILEFSKDFVPSLIFVLIILFSLNIKDNFCDESYPIILSGGYYFHLGFILKSMLYLLYLLCLNTHNFLKYSIGAFSFSLYLSYYIFILYSSSLLKRMPEGCSHIHPLHTIVIFLLVTTGLIDICRYITYIMLTIIGFPFMIYYFFSEPRDFIQKFGVDPDIVDNWPTVKATEEQVIDCVICSDEIGEGQQIMVLNCAGRHFYHAKCIKEWLKVKINCPVCRSSNVF